MREAGTQGSASSPLRTKCRMFKFFNELAWETLFLPRRTLRGVSLELCLTKLRFAAAMAEAARTREQAAAGTTATLVAAPGPAAAAAAGAAAAPGSCPPSLASPPAFPSPPSSCPAAAPPLSCQLVCMSATMAGLDAMCSWLGARLFMTNFRCVCVSAESQSADACNVYWQVVVCLPVARF